MSSFKIHNAESAPEESRPILREVEKNMGFVPNLMGVFSESPVTLKAYVTLMNLLKQSSLSEAERQVIFLATSFENDCSYCMAAHSKMAQRFKVDNALIKALREGVAIADSKIEALRKFARAVVKTKGFVSEADLNAVMAAGYSRAQVLDVIVAITVKTLTNLVAHVSHVPLDEAFSSEKWQHPEHS
jgi:uncharacterized peroxidase-related enzyme